MDAKEAVQVDSMIQLDRIEAKLNCILWEVRWGNLYAPNGKFVVIDPTTEQQIGDVQAVPPKPEWPEDE